jgi:hypothetical protein
MHLRTSPNALAAAAVLAMFLMTLPPDLAHAAPISPKPKSPAQQSCESRGYQWSDSKGCADRKCARAGTPSEPGDVWIQRVDGETIYRYCDGFTGKWVVLIQPGTPAAPPPTASQ